MPVDVSYLLWLLCSLEGLWNSYAHSPVHTPMLTFLRASGVFLEALVPVHPSGVCVPLHFAVFVLAHAPEHAFSLSWYCCAVDDLLLSTCAWILRVCCSVCVSWRVCGIVIPKRQCICQGSAFPCILLFLSCSCAYACLELVLVCLCSQRSSVVHVRVDPSCLL